MGDSVGYEEIDLRLESKKLVEQAEAMDSAFMSNFNGNFAGIQFHEQISSLNSVHELLVGRDAPESLRHRIQLLISLREKLQMIPCGQGIHPALKEHRWASIESELIDQGISKVILYGGGKHTTWLLKSGWPKSSDLSIEFILDDNSSSESIHGIPVITLEELVSSQCSDRVILPSSDAHEDLIVEKIQSFADNMDIKYMRVYTDIKHWRLNSVDSFTQEFPQNSIDAKQLTPTTISLSDPSLLVSAPAHRLQLGLPQNRAWLETFLKLPALVDWATGFMNDIDAAFSWDILESILQSERSNVLIVEIGTASGVSTARLAHGLNHLTELPWEIHSFDIADNCYFDHSRPVGSATGELAPQLTDRIHIHTKQNANDAAHAFSDRKIDLAVIDADHNHPAATLDLLALLPSLAPHAWVILHDIELELIMSESEDTYNTNDGPSRLFNAYTGPKVREERDAQTDSNTGALQMPEDPLALRPLLIALIAQHSPSATSQT